MDEQKKQKLNKILNVVVNVVVGVILVVALILTINNISSKKKGYTSLFGTAYMVVQSESMDPNGTNAKANPIDYEGLGLQPGFAKGDLLSVKILDSDEEKSNLKEGDIISFFMIQQQNGSDVRIINSHRIVKVLRNTEGQVVYQTKGDNNPGDDPYTIYALNQGSGNWCVIGVVDGNAGAIGHALNFFNSSTGFLVCIVIPSFLVVIFFAFNLVREILRIKKAGAVDERAKFEEELLAKLRAQGVQIPADMAPAKEPESEEPRSEGEDKN